MFLRFLSLPFALANLFLLRFYLAVLLRRPGFPLPARSVLLFFLQLLVDVLFVFLILDSASFRIPPFPFLGGASTRFRLLPKPGVARFLLEAFPPLAVNPLDVFFGQMPRRRRRRRAENRQRRQHRCDCSPLHSVRPPAAVIIP